MLGKSFVLSVVIAITLVLSLLFPIRVSADDGIPGGGSPPTEEETSGTGDDVSTESGIEDGQVPTGEAPVEGDAVSTETSPQETAVEDGGDGQTVEAPVEEQPSLAETVSAMNEAGVILADENGDIIPLVTEAAETALLFPDPIGCPPGVEPVSWGGTGLGCTGSYASIQAAINDVSVVAGWTIYIDPGTFVENVTVNKAVTLQGSGMGVTIIHPAVSNPNCGGGGGGSLCAGSSNVILVRSDNVTIRDLTIDGNNPLLTSGTTSNGVDVDARNGIITDHVNTPADTIDGLTVFNVEVENIYLRGIYASDSGTFNIHDNVVDNVAGDYASIALFNFGGSGVFANNTVSDSNDGIVANWSTGTQFLNNTVTNSGSGVHTDNAQAADVISGNTVQDGPANSYGIFVFAPYAPVSVTNNAVNNVDVGLALSGNGWGDSLNTITFSNNTVSTNSIGAYVTTDVWGYFFGDVSAQFDNNVFTGGDYGFYLESNGAGEYYSAGNYDCSGAGGDCVLNLSGSGNSITGQNLFAATIATGQLNWYNSTPAYYGVYNVDLRGNWWGDASGPNDTTSVPDGCGITLDNPTGLGGAVSECILYDSHLTSNPFPDSGGGASNSSEEKSSPKNIQPPVFVSNLFAFAGGPGTSGQAIPIACDDPQTVLSAGGINVTLTGLCDYEVILELLSAEAIQPNLNSGDTFLHGVRIVLLKNGVPVNTLPAGAEIVVSYPAKQGVPMQWNGSWVEMDGKPAGGRFVVEAGPGTFVLVSR